MGGDNHCCMVVVVVDGVRRHRTKTPAIAVRWWRVRWYETATVLVAFSLVVVVVARSICGPPDSMCTSNPCDWLVYS